MSSTTRVDVRYLPTSSVSLSDLQKRCSSWLGREELKAFNKLIRTDDRRDYLAAHALVRICLSSVLGCEAQAVMIAHASNGRPYVENTAIPLSLSHSRGMVVCAYAADSDLSGVSLGVDVEPLTAHDRMSEVAAILLSEREHEWVMVCDYPESIMLQLWTVKEAVLKARQTGFQTGNAGSSFHTVVCERPSIVQMGERTVSRYRLRDATIIESQVVDDTHVVSIAVTKGTALQPEIRLERIDAL